MKSLSLAINRNKLLIDGIRSNTISRNYTTSIKFNKQTSLLLNNNTQQQYSSVFKFNNNYFNLQKTFNNSIIINNSNNIKNVRFYSSADDNKKIDNTEQQKLKESPEPQHAEVDINEEPKSEVVNSQGIRVEPQYYIEFTCTYTPPGETEECGFRSKKYFSKHSYHKGVVIIRCDGCKKYHLIADHLGWTGYNMGKTIEEIMAAKGIPIQRTLNNDETIEHDTPTENTPPKAIGSGSN